MKLTPLIKTVFSIFGVVGACCAIAIPISRNLRRSSNSPMISTEEIKNQKISYDQLGQQIEQSRKKDNTLSHNLSGKEQLRELILGGNDKVGEVKELSGTHCSSESSHRENDCGYFGLNDRGLEFKVKANYQQADNDGKVYVVKKQNEKASYYDLSVSEGKSISAEDFNALKMEGNDNESNKGAIITNPSFVTSNSER